MKNQHLFKNKKILVLGLAKSGYTAAKLLHELGASVVVNDKKELEENAEAHKLLDLGLEVICGSHPLELFDQGFDFVVKNPGIPYSNPMVKKAESENIPVITEVEIAYQLSQADIIGITGSNGKTTTTSLIFEMLQAGKANPLLAGNIGFVSAEVATKTTPDHWMVMELSSFQLMGTKEFRPKISVFLNLFDAHLDYHGTKEKYGKAKAKIFENQTEEDYCVLNADDVDIVSLASSTDAKKVYFSTTRVLNEGAYIKDETIFFNNEQIVATDDVSLPGKHNLENILAAVSTAKLAGIDTETVVYVLKTFAPVKHRLQFVKNVDGRQFYNDSKATNILATQKAIEAFSSPIVLLAGGLDRGNSFDALIPSLQNVTAVVTFGQTSEKIAEAAQKAGIKMIKYVDNVEKAVPTAFELSSPGDVVLLSPACASWDQYKTFEERGDMFIEAVHRL